MAVSVRDARTAVLGLAVAIVGAPILADPMADTTALAARVVGAVLAVYLLWIAVRDGEWGTRRIAPRLGRGRLRSRPPRPSSATGPHGLGAPGLGPSLAQAAGFALAALAVAPLVTGRDLVRIGLGLLLLTHGALLVRVALGGTPSALEEIVTAGLVVGLGGGVAILANAARRDGARGLRARARGPVRRATLPAPAAARARLRDTQVTGRAGRRPRIRSIDP